MQLVLIGIWADLDVVKVEKQKKIEKMTKKKLKNQIFPFRMMIWKFCMTMRNGPKGGFAKENFKIDFTWSCEMLQEDVNCYYCIFYFEQSCEIA